MELNWDVASTVSKTARQETAFDEDLFPSAPESLPDFFIHDTRDVISVVFVNFISLLEIPARKTSSFFSLPTLRLQTERSDKNWRQKKLIFKTRSPWKASFGHHHENHAANDDEERKGMRILHHETRDQWKGWFRGKECKTFSSWCGQNSTDERNLYGIQSRLD